MHLVFLESSGGRYSAESPELPGVLIQSQDELTARRMIAGALSAAATARRKGPLSGILYLCLDCSDGG